ncbi:hypothetical protein MRX96_034757 [Rhipicephalus microplus]
MAKLAINKGMDVSISNGLDYERAYYVQVTQSKDRVEGLTGLQGEEETQLWYEVTVLVRDASRLPKEITPHHVVVGDVLKKEDVDRAVKDQERCHRSPRHKERHEPHNNNV